MPHAGLRCWAAVLLAAIPWINPFTFGPTGPVLTWLVSFWCGLALWLLALPRIAFAGWRLLGLAASLVLFAWAGHPGTGREAAYLAGGLALTALAAALAAEEEVGAWLRRGLLLAACVNALIGLCQYFDAASVLAPWINAARAGEAFGNLRQPNQYATLCWLGLAVLLWGPQRLLAPLAITAASVLAVGSAASGSRTALLQGLVLAALSAAWPGEKRRDRLVLCAVAGAAYVSSVFALPLLLEMATGDMPARTLLARLGGDEGCSSRIVLWSNVLHLIASKPRLGWGWGELDYAHFITPYPGPRFCDILDNAHNLPLHLAVELGIPAALLICGGFLWWVARQRPWAEREPQRQLAWALLAVILLHSLLEYPLWYGPFQIVFGASVGWLLAAPPATASRGRGAVSAALIVAVLAATAYGAWDYLRVSQIYLPPEQRREPWRQDPLAAARHSWLFASQARFAELTLTPLTRANARWMEATAEAMLHYSPEPRVIERLVESATLNGHEDNALAILARYRAAFPHDYEQWRSRQRPPQD